MGARIVNLSNNQFYTMVTSELTIGRSQNNDISLTEPKVSLKHARIVKRQKGYYLEDLGSTNGTRFQGRDIQLVHLRNNDIFRIGNSDFKFVEDSATVLDAVPHNIITPKTESKHPPLIDKKSVKWIPWGVGGGVLLILALLVFFFYPLHTVQAGTIVSCKHCGKEVANNVHDLNVSFFEKDNPRYVISKEKDYCQSCGNEQVSFTSHYYCKFCGQEYNSRSHSAPRREEKGDQNITEGFCNKYCAAGKKVEDYGNEANKLLERLTNPF